MGKLPRTTTAEIIDTLLRRGDAMNDMERRLERLREDAAECAISSGLATDKEKRDLFAKLAAHLTALADEVERAMKATKH